MKRGWMEGYMVLWICDKDMIYALWSIEESATLVLDVVALRWDRITRTRILMTR